MSVVQLMYLHSKYEHYQINDYVTVMTKSVQIYFFFTPSIMCIDSVCICQSVCLCVCVCGGGGVHVCHSFGNNDLGSFAYVDINVENKMVKYVWRPSHLNF